jgi:hypothetical protein
MTVIDPVVITFLGRAMREDARSKATGIAPTRRAFHAGCRETCLQVIAEMTGNTVANIRRGVLGVSHDSSIEYARVVGELTE